MFTCPERKKKSVPAAYGPAGRRARPCRGRRGGSGAGGGRADGAILWARAGVGGSGPPPLSSLPAVQPRRGSVVAGRGSLRLGRGGSAGPPAASELLGGSFFPLAQVDETWAALQSAGQLPPRCCPRLCQVGVLREGVGLRRRSPSRRSPSRRIAAAPARHTGCARDPVPGSHREHSEVGAQRAASAPRARRACYDNLVLWNLSSRRTEKEQKWGDF